MRRYFPAVLSFVAVLILLSGALHSQPPQTPAAPEGQDRQAGEQTGPAEVAAPAGQEEPPQAGQSCIECHGRITPGIVQDWQLSKHSRNDVACPSCHGERHNSMEDPANAGLAQPQVCAQCHDPQVEQFKKGKHALAWTAMEKMPSLHWQPMAEIEGLKGCGGCHRVGLKTAAVVDSMRAKGAGFGASSCDVCHTRHLFSVEEALSPQACRTCHTGIDHPQWEMYSGSKHGVRYLLKQSRVLPEDAAAPTCQTCHFQDGDHENRTAWGFLGVRLPMPEDTGWKNDRTTVLQGLGVLDPAGNPTARYDIVQKNDMARLTQEAFDAERARMLRTCNQCHSINFARGELEKGDQMVRESDRLMAEGIRTVAGLYKDGLLKQPQSYAYAFPDLLTFHDAPTSIELKLFQMFQEYRMRTFQGAFHANPDYSLWYGWSPMQRTLTEIREKSSEMREAKPESAPGAPPKGPVRRRP